MIKSYTFQLNRYIHTHTHTRLDRIVNGHPSKTSVEFIESMTVSSTCSGSLPGQEGCRAVASCIPSSWLVYLEQSRLTVHSSYGTQWHRSFDNQQYIHSLILQTSHSKIKSSSGTRCVSPSIFMTHQVHPAIKQKTIPWMEFGFTWDRTNPNWFPKHIPHMH